jgi:hypothetical protein
MINRLGSLAAVCALAGVLATGCGAKTVTVTTGSTTPTTTTPTTATTPPTGTTGTSTTPTTPGQLRALVAQEVAACKTTVNSQGTLSASAKSQLDAVCDKAGTGDVAAVQKAASQVCQEIIKDQVPAGAARTQALASCPKP